MRKKQAKRLVPVHSETAETTADYELLKGLKHTRLLLNQSIRQMEKKLREPHSDPAGLPRRHA